MNEIHLHIGRDGWLATFYGPHAVEIKDLFGSTTIPTAFTAAAPVATVIAELQSRNPGCRIGAWQQH